MSYYKFNTDGTIQSANKQHDGFSPMSELAVDIDGNYYSHYLPTGEPDLAKIQAELDEATAQEIKQAKLDALAILTVTTSNGNEFDADDVARQDMLSAIEASNTLGLTEQGWKLADNSWKVIQLAELKEASALAIQAKGAVLAG